MNDNHSPIIHVGIGQMAVSRDSEAVLISRGLGSCIAVCLHDDIAMVGGLAHIMLPWDKGSEDGRCPAKYADTGIERLLREIVACGANKRCLKVKIAGGASMFTIPEGQPKINIGDRNIEAVQATIEQFKLPLLTADIGKNYGRTIEFYIGTGELKIRSVGCELVVI